MSDLLTLKDIKARSVNSGAKKVALEKWGGSVMLRPMTPAETDRLLAERKEGNVFSAQVAVVFGCVVEPAFKSLSEVAELPVGLVSEAYLAIEDISGLSDSDESVKKS